MIKLNRIILALILSAPLFGACGEDAMSDSSGNGSEFNTPLHIKRAGLNPKDTRASSLNNNTSFGSGDSIGISVINADGSTTNYNHINVKYVSSGVLPSQTWSTDNAIGLGRAAAHVSAYHPYHVSLNPTALPVNCSNGIDWLYAVYQTWNGFSTLDYAAPDVSIELQHAQAVFIVKLVNQGYIFDPTATPTPKTGVISHVGIGSDPVDHVFGRKGILNSTDSTYTNITDTIAETIPTGDPRVVPNYNTGPTYSAIDTLVIDTFLVIPIENPAFKDGKIRFTFVIDGEVKTAETSIRSIERGKIYTFTLKMKDESGPVLVIDDKEGNGVEITPWNDTTTLSPVIMPELWWTVVGP